MIIVHQIRIEELGPLTRVSCSLRSEDLPGELHFEFPTAQAGAIDIAEPNWAAVALLYPAMRLGRPLVLEAQLSPRLLHALRNDVQQLLVAHDPRLSVVDIHAGSTEEAPAELPRGVGTGFSAGVDSFATLRLHSAESAPKQLRVTDLTVFNVGAFGDTPGVPRLMEEFYARSSAFAQRKGFGAYLLDSNLDDFYRRRSVEPVFQKTHTLRSAAAALVLQNRFRYYLYSSSYAYGEIKVGRPKSMAYIDPVLLPLLSTEKLEFLSTGSGLTRGQKTALLVGDPDARDMLDVCVASQEARAALPRQNCSRCWKCNRTLLTLEALEVLEDFDRVFDVDYYRRNRSRLVRNVALHASSGDPAALEALRMAGARGLPVPMAWMRARRQLVNLHRRLPMRRARS